jgi:Spy/CpxP family protein refolding chaperone
MKTLTSVLAALTLSLALAAAPQGPRSQLQNMVDKLNLTADQRAKADPILDEDAKQVRALREDSALSAEDRSKKTAEIRRQSDLKLKPILTDEQWKKLEQLREERKAQGKQDKKKQ